MIINQEVAVEINLKIIPTMFLLTKKQSSAARRILKVAGLEKVSIKMCLHTELKQRVTGMDGFLISR